MKDIELNRKLTDFAVDTENSLKFLTIIFVGVTDYLRLKFYLGRFTKKPIFHAQAEIGNFANNFSHFSSYNKNKVFYTQKN